MNKYLPDRKSHVVEIPIEFAVKKGIRDAAGLWSSENLEEVGDKYIPPLLKETANSKFPLIEDLLSKRGISIPDSWTVGNMLAALAVSMSLQVESSGQAPSKLGKPEISLILDKYYKLEPFLHRNSDITQNKPEISYDKVGFVVITGDLCCMYMGSIWLPENHYSQIPGYPAHVAQKYTQKYYDVHHDIVERGYSGGDYFAENGEPKEFFYDLVDFVGSLIRHPDQPSESAIGEV